jgi:hypothetical protein
MSEVSEFIAAVVAIAKDPKGWEKRLGDADDIAKQLAEARKTKKEADEAAKQATTDLETARYERGQAERSSRDAAAQSAANNARAAELDKRERLLEANERAALAAANNLKANQDARENDLNMREKLAAKKLNDAQKLMASYDEAKHKAAQALAN